MLVTGLAEKEYATAVENLVTILSQLSLYFPSKFLYITYQALGVEC